MVVVYLKNGEKAPLPDANEVRIDAGAEARGSLLRCFFNEQEVGVFKWDEVAGYTLSAPPSLEASPQPAYEAWGLRQNV